MKPDQPSTTAENNAVLRAIESMRPKHERMFSDPLAVFFLPDRLAEAASSASFCRHLLARWERAAPGACGAVLVRTRFIDDCLAEEIGRGLRQLVVLGAGYDTRALRFPQLKEAVAVFELDHPETQRVKMEKIRRHMGSLPAHVTFTPINFEKESIAQKLLACPYDPREKTLFIWEGVSYYLPAEAVDRTLSFIGACSGEQSSVVFDYFPPSVADGTCRLAEAAGLRKGLKQFGEEILFGIRPDLMARFLENRGFTCVKNEAARDYGRAVISAGRRKLPVSEIFFFAHGAVKPACSST